MLENNWSDEKAEQWILGLEDRCSKELALRIYSTRLQGTEKRLCLHGGGNSSVKTEKLDFLGCRIPAIFVKAAGFDLSEIGPEGFSVLELEPLIRSMELDNMDDESMLNLFRKSLFDHRSPTPSIETLLHACLPGRYVDHTHCLAVLILTSQSGGLEILKKEMPKDYIVLEYQAAGFELAKAAIVAFRKKPEAKGMILAKHGALTWGDSAKESHAAMIELAQAAEKIIQRRSRSSEEKIHHSTEGIATKYQKIAPIVRGELAKMAEFGPREGERFVLKPSFSGRLLEFLTNPKQRETILSSPITPDHLVRSRVKPAFVSVPNEAPAEQLHEMIHQCLEQYQKEYQDYLKQQSPQAEFMEDFDYLPRMILIEGIGGICIGRDEQEASLQLQILEQNIEAKSEILKMGGNYEGLSSSQCFAMEFKTTQQAKLKIRRGDLAGRTAVITGAGGAIGLGIVRELLERDCHVLATDIDGDSLEKMKDQIPDALKKKVHCHIMDVADEQSVMGGIDEAVMLFGGVDILVINAGLAHVCRLEDMGEHEFVRVQRVNTNGTLLLFKHFGRHMKNQGSGGDMVLVSTKNVFAPGASFGAYSATKAAAHQLARIASLELAESDIRVNMVSPDAVFAEGDVKSGLWREVGPGRMKARGLDEDGLEEYYRNRNLLKSKIGARDVGRAVLFFVTRQTPTTGATLPVDGGLPDATPR